MSARVLLALALACFACAPATAQRMRLDQYQHTAWTVRDGAPGGVRQFAQGADGVLWIASDVGLFHFDGVRFERFEPPAGQPLPSVRFLLALPDTSLWIGHRVSGASLLRRGRIVTYGAKEGLPDGPVTAFARDSGGTVWAATAAGLARFDGRRWKEVGPDEGFPGGLTIPVLVDRRGTVWAGTFQGFYFLPRGARRFQKRDVIVAGESMTGYLATGPDGSVWATAPGTGLFLVADTSGRPAPPGTPPSAFQGLGVVYAVHPDRPAVGFGQMAGRLMQVWLPGTPGIPPAPAGRAVSAEIPFSRAAGMSGDWSRPRSTTARGRSGWGPPRASTASARPG